MQNTVRLTTVSALLALVTSCVNLRQPDIPPINTNITTWQNNQTSPLPAFSELLASAELRALVETALANNHNLTAAAARLAAVQQQAAIASGKRWPGLNVTLDQTTAKRQGRETDTASGQLGLSWEIDVWGRVAASAVSARASAAEQQALYQAARFSLAAQVIKLWYDGLEARQQLALSRARAASLQKSLAVIQDGFERGIRTAFELYSARAELANNEAVLAQRQRNLNNIERNLAVLLGQPPQAGLINGDELPEFTAPVPASLGVDLLSRRPDVQAAMQAITAQHARVGVAFANRLPALRLSGSSGASSNKLSNILEGESSIWSIFGGITAPLFQGGALLAEQHRQQALLTANVAAYQQTLLNAVREVEAALDNETLLLQQEQAAAKAVTISQQAEAQALEQYVAGISNLNTWLQAQRSLFDRQSNLLQNRASRLKNRVDMYLALGGNFDHTAGTTP